MDTFSASAVVFLLGSRTTALPPGGDESTDIGNKGFPTSYFFFEKYSSAITAHIAPLVLGWCFVLPIVVLPRTLRSRVALPSHFIFLVLNSLGLLLGNLHDSQIPDLDPNKSDLHRTLGWSAMCVASAYACLALIFAYAGRGQANAPPYEPPAGQSGCEKLKELPTKVTGTRELSQSTRNGFIISKRVPGIVSSWALCILSVVYNVVDYTILPFGFIVLVTGTMAYDDIMRSHEFFNWLAHLLKGSIIICYGLFTLGRFIGCWANFGWAWNKRPSAHIVGNRRYRIPSVEAVESFVIFLNSVTSIFLESLSKWGDVWSAADLQRASVSMLLFGGGLAGMLLESTYIRRWINNTILQTLAQGSLDEAWQPSNSQCGSLNPIPVLVMFLFGLITRSRYQDCRNPTLLHYRWDTMLVGFALARGMTYLLLFIKPSTSYLPARPPTEIIAAFFLISGGTAMTKILFIHARDVQDIRSYDMYAMFTLTVGASAFIIAH
ncbi:uncharacterized protein N7506_000090 [Penicillium brevicompactum]|uniref:uncharacterized protein n=1 Tax=Penicillium brevicompactum TaxID=5074 RepID=UPI002541C8B7|nr:uncharacterized protein N7506_000090 [Penicillium brevicompactum]KAJ5346837.1 hypothetical protein N7506_000090 [Penicillium brevicompactum]